jgi:hypothetical protein
MANIELEKLGSASCSVQGVHGIPWNRWVGRPDATGRQGKQLPRAKASKSEGDQRQADGQADAGRHGKGQPATREPVGNNKGGVAMMGWQVDETHRTHGLKGMRNWNSPLQQNDAWAMDAMDGRNCFDMKPSCQIKRNKEEPNPFQALTGYGCYGFFRVLPT